MHAPDRSDDLRFVRALLARLEKHPNETPDDAPLRTAGLDDPHRGPLDWPAWRELLREYGLTAEDDDDAVREAWADLLSVACPATHGRRPLADSPTAAIPGTWAKVEIMRRRLARGEKLFHPDDAPLLQDRLVLIPDRGRHNDRSQVTGVGEETHLGVRRAA